MTNRFSDFARACQVKCLRWFSPNREPRICPFEKNKSGQILLWLTKAFQGATACAKLSPAADLTVGTLRYLGVTAAPVFCTKIASKLTRTYTDRHGLKDLVRELLGKEISKQQQSSDWGGMELSEAQREYAASDVRYLHAMHAILVERLARELAWGAL